MAVTILIVDDEPFNVDLLEQQLEELGYDTQSAANGQKALDAVATAPPDLILLDVMMPKLDGLKVCEEIRATGLQTPVMFLTVKGDPSDRIRGLEVGGDDYLAKPFHLKELLLRVTAILRRSNWYNQSTPSLSFGGNEIDFQTYHARAWDGSEHALTHKEAMIMKVLAEQLGVIVPREDILDKVWGYEVYPSTRTIDNFIVRLRRRFERNPEAPEYFHTVRGVGYRFTQEPETPTE